MLLQQRVPIPTFAYDIDLGDGWYFIVIASPLFIVRYKSDWILKRRHYLVHTSTTYRRTQRQHEALDLDITVTTRISSRRAPVASTSTASSRRSMESFLDLVKNALETTTWIQSVEHSCSLLRAHASHVSNHPEGLYCDVLAFSPSPRCKDLAPVHRQFVLEMGFQPYY